MPKPKGSLWTKMVFDKLQTEGDTIVTHGEREATRAEFWQARAFTAILRAEQEQYEAHSLKLETQGDGQLRTKIASSSLMLAAEVEPAEYEPIIKRRYKAVCGSLLWLARFCHCEMACAVSFCCRVMARPSEEAWKCCMQIIAWLRDNKHIGVKFSSDNNEHGLVATSDASNKIDPHDKKCQASHTIHTLYRYN